MWRLLNSDPSQKKYLFGDSNWILIRLRKKQHNTSACRKNAAYPLFLFFIKKMGLFLSCCIKSSIHFTGWQVVSIILWPRSEAKSPSNFGTLWNFFLFYRNTPNHDVRIYVKFKFKLYWRGFNLLAPETITSTPRSPNPLLINPSLTNRGSNCIPPTDPFLLRHEMKWENTSSIV